MQTHAKSQKCDTHVCSIIRLVKTENQTAVVRPFLVIFFAIIVNFMDSL